MSDPLPPSEIEIAAKQIGIGVGAALIWIYFAVVVFRIILPGLWGARFEGSTIIALGASAVSFLCLVFIAIALHRGVRFLFKI